MYGLRWLLTGLFIIFLLISLSGCGTKAPYDADILQILLQEGTLAAFTPGEPSAFTHQLTPVWEGDIVVPWHSSLEFYFPNVYNVAFDTDGAAWLDSRLQLGYIPDIDSEIEEGAFLASLNIEYDTAMEITRLDNAFVLQQFNTRFENENTRRLSEISVLRNQAGNQERAALLLAQRELERDLFIVESARQREALTQAQSQITKLYLYAPTRGVITHRAMVFDDMLYRDIPLVQNHGRNIITILDDSVFYFYIEGRRDVFRFGQVLEARPLMVGGPAFDVIVATDALVHPVSREGTQTILLRPADKDAFTTELQARGLTPRDLADIGFRIEAPKTLAASAVLTSARAIHTEGVRNFVFVYDQGTLRRRYVDIGVIHGDTVQILSGLVPGQQVVIP